MANILSVTDIARIVPGAVIEQTFDTSRGEVVPNARWHARKVVSIHARRDDIKGVPFVCGYTEFGENSQMSFSAKAGDAYIRLVSSPVEG